MRLLTVRQPWAWAIIHGGKDVENRTRNIAGSYRGTVAIHAALSLADSNQLVAEAVGRVAREKRPVGGRQVPSRIGEPDESRWHVHERYGYRGAIIGVVDLIDGHAAKRSLGGVHSCWDDSTPIGQTCSVWADHCDTFPGHRGFHLVLANPRPLAEPIPYRGGLGLRRLDDDLAARIEAAVRDA